MKKFFGEFKKFITRGNVVDMAVGVIVGGAFTAIVNGLSNNILKPIINYVLFLVLGKDSLSEIYTFLHKEMKDVVHEAGAVIGTEIDLAQSIYIDWGAFINAIINFFLIAIVLFTIVKIFNKFREERNELAGKLAKGKLTKEQKKELKAAGVKIRDKQAVKAYFEQKKLAEEQKAAEEKAAAEAAARAEREANPTTEDLLKLILAELKKD
jgi:large conductance mechanosensitive channel